MSTATRTRGLRRLPLELPAPEKRVAAGVEWLTKHYPGWEDHVTARRLDIANCSRDPLGLLLEKARDRVVASLPWSLLLYNGFAVRCLGVPDDEYRAECARLNAAWREVLA